MGAILVVITGGMAVATGGAVVVTGGVAAVHTVAGIAAVGTAGTGMEVVPIGTADTLIGGGIIPTIMTTSRCTAAQLLGRF